MHVPLHHIKSGGGDNTVQSASQVRAHNGFKCQQSCGSTLAPTGLFTDHSSSSGCQQATPLVNVDTPPIPVPSWASVISNKTMNGLVQCGLQIHGNCGSVQLVNTQATQPNSHFFLQGTRGEQEVRDWPRHGRNCRRDQRREQENDNYLLFVPPETPILRREASNSGRRGPSLSPAGAASGHQVQSGLDFSRSVRVRR